MRTASEVRKLLQQHKAELAERNPAWVVADLDSGNSVGIRIRKSLISVLAEDDWQTPCIDFVRQSLRDLKEVGILEALVAIPFAGEADDRESKR